MLDVPGADRIMLYRPQHPVAYTLFAMISIDRDEIVGCVDHRGRGATECDAFGVRAAQQRPSVEQQAPHRLLTPEFDPAEVHRAGVKRRIAARPSALCARR